MVGASIIMYHSGMDIYVDFQSRAFDFEHCRGYHPFCHLTATVSDNQLLRTICQQRHAIECLGSLVYAVPKSITMGE